MAERFVYPPTSDHAARVSIAADASTATFTGTALAARDWAGAQLWITPDDAAPYLAGIVAETDPQGDYDNLELPLFRPWPGAAIEDAKFALVQGLGEANGATQAAIYARFAAFLQQNAGLVLNTADDVDLALVPQNTLFVDAVTRTLRQWRNGVLETVSIATTPFAPVVDYDVETTYAFGALVTRGGKLWYSLAADNVGNVPESSPSWWLAILSGGDRYDVALYDAARPGSGEVIAKLYPLGVTFPAGLTESRAGAEAAATASAAYSFRRNNVEFATLTFAAESASGVFACAADTAFAAGDVLTVIAPAPRDDTLSGVAITLVGYR
jgi:hypothetical protein